jgi:hypothetical protein
MGTMEPQGEQQYSQRHALGHGVESLQQARGVHKFERVFRLLICREIVSAHLHVGGCGNLTV